MGYQKPLYLTWESNIFILYIVVSQRNVNYN